VPPFCSSALLRHLRSGRPLRLQNGGTGAERGRHSERRDLSHRKTPG
jgi:hypothetical protein